MYLYFDRTGTLKEIVNDEALRQGNYDINKIYVFVEDRDISSIDVSYLLENGLIVGPQNYDDFTNPASDDNEDCYIPFDRKRDLKYFKYYHAYKFLVITLEADLNGNSPLDQAGWVHCEMEAILSGGSQLKLGQFNFSVEENSVLNQKYVASQEYLALSDYQFLRSMLDGIQSGISNFVPYSGATDDVNLGTHSLYAVFVRVSSNEHTIDLAIGADGKPYLSYDTGQKVFFLPIDGATGTLATQGWVNDKNFVPFEENGDVDIGQQRLTAGQVNIEEGHVSALFNLQQNGTLEIVNHDDSDNVFTFEFPIDGEEEDTYHIATREWVNAQDFVPYSGATKDLNLGGHDLIFKMDDHGTNREWNIKINTGNEIVFKNVTNNELFILTSSTANATQHIATRAWVDANTIKIYKHFVEITSSTLGRQAYMVLLSFSNTPYTSMTDIAYDFDNGEIWGVRVYDLTLACYCAVANFYGGDIYYTDTQGVSSIDSITGITDTVS